MQRERDYFVDLLGILDGFFRLNKIISLPQWQKLVSYWLYTERHSNIIIHPRVVHAQVLSSRILKISFYKGPMVLSSQRVCRHFLITRIQTLTCSVWRLRRQQPGIGLLDDESGKVTDCVWNQQQLRWPNYELISFGLVVFIFELPFVFWVHFSGNEGMRTKYAPNCEIVYQEEIWEIWFLLVTKQILLRFQEESGPGVGGFPSRNHSTLSTVCLIFKLIVAIYFEVLPIVLHDCIPKILRWRSVKQFIHYE